MSEGEALEAAKLYLKKWSRNRCHDFCAEYIPANVSIAVDNRATWRITFLEPALGGGEDVFAVFVDELTGEAWSTVAPYGGAKSPRSWDDPWALKKLEKRQKAWGKEVEENRRREADE